MDSLNSIAQCQRELSYVISFTMLRETREVVMLMMNAISNEYAVLFVLTCSILFFVGISTLEMRVR